MPRPVDALPCGSRSMSRTCSPIAASAVPRLIAVVVLPTPPFWLASTRTRGFNRFSKKILRKTAKRESGSSRVLRRFAVAHNQNGGFWVDSAVDCLELESLRMGEGSGLRVAGAPTREDSDRAPLDPWFGVVDENGQGGERAGGDCVHRHQRLRRDRFD